VGNDVTITHVRDALLMGENAGLGKKWIRLTVEKLTSGF